MDQCFRERQCITFLNSVCDITSRSPCPCWQVFDELEEIGKTIQEDVLDAGMPVHGSMGGDISKCPYYATKMGAHFILFSENMQMNQFIHILAMDKDKSPSFISFDFSTFKEVRVLKHTGLISFPNMCSNQQSRIIKLRLKRHKQTAECRVFLTRSFFQLVIQR